ncbi:AlkZ family DNA glycosylase [Virgibacillus sp. NKC19-3]|uniref:winged helix-turn-helix domain-containing protein n=1 Tax=Virgibacillus saliphilus TaxID=2831674 RepID=UPI001C9BA006|nr:winged helix DNA-binding domain-containing protein [Virgibacillus sp. NKC19-3]MBY7145006.1 AlkZ family DNA glycosylase [Virgibacillus sp. NKC19-3]
MKPFEASRCAVRRFLLDTQHLLFHSDIGDRSVLESTEQLIRQLECVQLDPIASVERNQHLVLAARIPGYEPEMLNELLNQGKLFEYWANAACTIPMEDYPLFEATRNRFRTRLQMELDKLEPAASDVLERLEVEGSLPSRDFRSRERVHGGWDNKIPKTKATSHALNLLQDIGEIRVVRRQGSERYFDLTSRTIPSKLLKEAKNTDEAKSREALLEKYLRAYRVFDSGDARFGWQKLNAKERREAITKRVDSGEVIPLDIEGVRRSYFILATDLDRLKEHERTIQVFLQEEASPIRFLPPLDNLLWRRERLVDLFDFSYKWEVYTPKTKRCYGYYAMPILAGDRLIGRIDPGLDRKNRRLHIRLLQLEPEVKITFQLRENIRQALKDFAAFHHASDIVIERTEPRDLSLSASSL